MAMFKRKPKLTIAILLILVAIIVPWAIRRMGRPKAEISQKQTLGEQLTEKFSDLARSQGMSRNISVILWAVNPAEEAPLLAFMGYGALVAEDGTVGVIAYGYDNTGVAELNPKPDLDYDREFLIVLEDWVAPEAWRGQCLLINTIYTYDISTDQFAVIDHVVYTVQDVAAARANFAALVDDDQTCWIWRNDEYICQTYAEISRRHLDTPSTSSLRGAFSCVRSGGSDFVL